MCYDALTSKKERRIAMKTKLSKVLFALMCTFVVVIQSAAALAAGGASFLNSYQPKVPEKLRK